MQIRWRLRQVMASRDVWTGKELRDLLIRRAGLSLSAPSISALVKGQPAQVKVATLEALCTALRCTPNELFGVEPPREVSIADEPEAGEQPPGL